MKTQNFLLPFIIILTIYGNGYSQISNGGTPHSFLTNSIKNSVAGIKMPAVNVDSLFVADSLEYHKAKLFRFGYAIDVNINMENSGTWDTLSNGDKIWRLKIYSQNAFSLNFIFDDFWLPEGAQFFVYNEDKNMILGAFTSEASSNPYDKFATDLIKGDTTILEYFEPTWASGGRINIDKVIHGYKDMFKSGHGKSGSCNIDVTCAEGDNWCVEKRAVSMILVDNNTRLCTGCLINNVKNDLTPYYLTAFHCIDSDQNGTLSQSEINDAQTWIFRFKYWSKTCNQGDDALGWVSISGSTVKANWSGTDFALFQLNAQPPSSFGIHYAGWDRLVYAPFSVIGIHHPSGDVMKISFKNNTPTSVNSYWQVIWDNGTTEPGSSGSPLFNNSHKIIGQLFGGTASCSNPNGFDQYGDFGVSWYGGGTPQTRLRDWLDPDNTGATYVDPITPTIYLINRTLTGTHKFASPTKIQVEGNVITTGYFPNQQPFPKCRPSNQPYIADAGSNVEFKSKKIVIKPGTYFKPGSFVHVVATNVQCSDNLIAGDDIDFFCTANVSMKTVGQNTPSNPNIQNTKKENIHDNFSDKIFETSFAVMPNPTNGTFKLQANNNLEYPKQIIIRDVLGRNVAVIENMNTYEYEFNLEKESPGIYMITVYYTDKVISKRVIKN